MELTLNLAWALIATIVLGVWLLVAPTVPVLRHRQLVAVILLVLILFPVISVTDDLLATQNPAEADCCLRKDHSLSGVHSIFSAIASLPMPAFADLTLTPLYSRASGSFLAPLILHPSHDSVQNRPPPVG